MKNLVILIITIFIFISCTEPEINPYLNLDYSNWKKTTNIELDYPIPGHMDNYRIAYINQIGENLSITQQGQSVIHDYPKGTIIIKEIYENTTYQPGDKVISLTAMVKNPQSPYAQGGWIWIMKPMPNGKEIINRDGFCFNCHNDANERHPYGQGNPDEEYRDCVFYTFTK